MMQMTATVTWAYLAANPNAQLVDVRTKAEWRFVGIASLDALDQQPVLIEWLCIDGTPSADFIRQLGRH